MGKDSSIVEDQNTPGNSNADRNELNKSFEESDDDYLVINVVDPNEVIEGSENFLIIEDDEPALQKKEKPKKTERKQPEVPKPKEIAEPAVKKLDEVKVEAVQKFDKIMDNTEEKLKKKSAEAAKTVKDKVNDVIEAPTAKINKASKELQNIADELVRPDFGKDPRERVRDSESFKRGKEAINNMADKVKDDFDDVKDDFKDGANKLKKEVKGQVEKAKDKTEKAKDNVAKDLGKAKENIKNNVKDVKKNIEKDLSKMKMPELPKYNIDLLGDDDGFQNIKLENEGEPIRKPSVKKEIPTRKPIIEEPIMAAPVLDAMSEPPSLDFMKPNNKDEPRQVVREIPKIDPIIDKQPIQNLYTDARFPGFIMPGNDKEVSKEEKVLKRAFSGKENPNIKIDYNPNNFGFKHEHPHKKDEVKPSKDDIPSASGEFTHIEPVTPPQTPSQPTTQQPQPVEEPKRTANRKMNLFSFNKENPDTESLKDYIDSRHKELMEHNKEGFHKLEKSIEEIKESNQTLAQQVKESITLSVSAVHPSNPDSHIPEDLMNTLYPEGEQSLPSYVERRPQGGFYIRDSREMYLFKQ